MLSAEKLDKWLKPTTRTGRPGPLLKVPRLPSQLSAAMEAGALGLGALLTTLATTAAADVTGVLMASVVAALGLFIIPARRRHGKMKMLEKIASVRTRLINALRAQFEKEINRSVQHINEAIAPYTRFIRAESDKWLQTQATLDRLRNEMDQLKGRLERI